MVPAGVRHPLSDGGVPFFLRTVGPMIAPGHRVLVLDAGAGAAAVVAATRGAHVVAHAGSEASAGAIAVNAQAHGVVDALEVRTTEVREEGFDLVFQQALAPPPRREQLERWLGERGRLVRLVLRGADEPKPPAGWRSVQLARSPGVFSAFEARSVGWDLELARAVRHAARGSDDTTRRADVSRRRWQGVDPEVWAEQVAQAAGEDGIPTS